MPGERVSVDGDAGFACILDKVAHGGEVHRSVIGDTGGVLHLVAGGHLVEVGGDEFVDYALLVEVGGSDGASQVEVGVCSAVDVRLQRFVVIQILVLSHTLRLCHVERLQLVVRTRCHGSRQGKCWK